MQNNQWRFAMLRPLSDTDWIMPTQLERTEKTQADILAVATELFAAKGYVGTSLAEVVEQTGITTGAIYHHFGGKKGLFIAVAERMEQLILNEIVNQSSKSAAGWAGFAASVLLTLEICARPDIQKIVFQDAPTIIGSSEWKEIEIRYGFGLMHKSLRELKEQGIIVAPNVELTAQMLLGALMEAAHFVAMSPKKSAALRDAKQSMQQLLNALPV